jgi:hypothetical protein
MDLVVVEDTARSAVPMVEVPSVTGSKETDSGTSLPHLSPNLPQDSSAFVELSHPCRG